jgi:AcrR family transcriptional regulator
MPRANTETGRAAQRRRTRKAIVTAAADLLATGVTPSMAEVADAAEVSRRTVYMYFPTLEQLLIDASLASMVRDTVDAELDAIADEEDVEARVATMVRAVQRNFGSTEQQGRTLLRLTVDRPDLETPSGQPRRGYRRIEWIERAIEPLKPRLTAARYEQLVSALAMVTGWEAMIVARDIRALSLRKAEDVSVWAARALVRAALEEAGPPPRRQVRRRSARD